MLSQCQYVDGNIHWNSVVLYVTPVSAPNGLWVRVELQSFKEVWNRTRPSSVTYILTARCWTGRDRLLNTTQRACVASGRTWQMGTVYRTCITAAMPKQIKQRFVYFSGTCSPICLALVLRWDTKEFKKPFAHT